MAREALYADDACDEFWARLGDAVSAYERRNVVVRDGQKRRRDEKRLMLERIIRLARAQHRPVVVDG